MLSLSVYIRYVLPFQVNPEVEYQYNYSGTRFQ